MDINLKYTYYKLRLDNDTINDFEINDGIIIINNLIFVDVIEVINNKIKGIKCKNCISLRKIKNFHGFVTIENDKDDELNEIFHIVHDPELRGKIKARLLHLNRDIPEFLTIKALDKWFKLMSITAKNFYAIPKGKEKNDLLNKFHCDLYGSLNGFYDNKTKRNFYFDKDQFLKSFNQNQFNLSKNVFNLTQTKFKSSKNLSMMKA